MGINKPGCASGTETNSGGIEVSKDSTMDGGVGVYECSNEGRGEAPRINRRDVLIFLSGWAIASAVDRGARLLERSIVNHSRNNLQYQIPPKGQFPVEPEIPRKNLLEDASIT